MTKTEIIAEISENLKVDKNTVSDTLEAFMKTVKKALSEGDNIYLRGFGTFQVKHRAEKVARDISKGLPIIIPPHSVPSFKPSKSFVERIKKVTAEKEMA